VYARSAAPVRRARKISAEQALLEELWRISHFGWVSDTTIRRALIISGLDNVLGPALADHLRELLNRGWIEQRLTVLTERQSEWRLTTSGRNTLHGSG
jgi:DNA-binding HxlR family transcriptional regulator